MNNTEDSSYEEFKEFFPLDTKIILSETLDRFEEILRCRCKDKNDFTDNWLKPYQNLNNIGLQARVTRPIPGNTVLFKFAKFENLLMHRKLKPCKRHLQSEMANVNDLLMFKQQKLVNRESSGYNNEMIHYRPTNKQAVQHVVCDRLLDSKSSFNVNPIIEGSINKSDAHEMAVVNYAHEEFVETQQTFETVENIPTKLEPIIDHKSVIASQNWMLLKEKLISLFENWEENKSVDRYEALKVALAYLENCDMKNVGTADISSGPTGLYNADANDDSKSSGIIVIEIPKSRPRSIDQSKHFWVELSANEAAYRRENCVSSIENPLNIDRSTDHLSYQENVHEELSNYSTLVDSYHYKSPKDSTLLDHKYVKRTDVIG